LSLEQAGTTPDGGIRYPSELFVTANAFALGQVLNFGTLAYITDCHSELHPLGRAALTSRELSVPPTLPGLLGADLKVLTLWIQHGLGPNPTMLDHR
jgi:hypothetical protein